MFDWARSLAAISRQLSAHQWKKKSERERKGISLVWHESEIEWKYSRAQMNLYTKKMLNDSSLFSFLSLSHHSCYAIHYRPESIIFMFCYVPFSSLVIFAFSLACLTRGRDICASPVIKNIRMFAIKFERESEQQQESQISRPGGQQTGRFSPWKSDAKQEENSRSTERAEVEHTHERFSFFSSHNENKTQSESVKVFPAGFIAREKKKIVRELSRVSICARFLFSPSKMFIFFMFPLLPVSVAAVISLAMRCLEHILSLKIIALCVLNSGSHTRQMWWITWQRYDIRIFWLESCFI